jgi:hypothetical protein
LAGSGDHGGNLTDLWHRHNGLRNLVLRLWHDVILRQRHDQPFYSSGTQTEA